MMLGVNVDHVATVREARKESEPDPVAAAALAIDGGADGITVHLREDRRHIQDRDVKKIRALVNREMNMEMAATQEMINIALKIRPDLVTIVPEKRAELTTEGGLAFGRNIQKIKRAVKTIQAENIPVSLFINPSVKDVEFSAQTGATMVEIHTGLYANASGKRRLLELNKVDKSVRLALQIGLKANAGHGLDYSNIRGIARIKGIRALYIGHSIVAMSIYTGIKKAVRDMKRLIRDSAR